MNKNVKNRLEEGPHIFYYTETQHVMLINKRTLQFILARVLDGELEVEPFFHRILEQPGKPKTCVYTAIPISVSEREVMMSLLRRLKIVK